MTIETAKLMLRAERDHLLAQSDWTQMPDAPLTEAQKTAWQVYRQALRDLPQGEIPMNEKGHLDDRAVAWPTKP